MGYLVSCGPSQLPSAHLSLVSTAVTTGSSGSGNSGSGNSGSGGVGGVGGVGTSSGSVGASGGNNDGSDVALQLYVDSLTLLRSTDSSSRSIVFPSVSSLYVSKIPGTVIASAILTEFIFDSNDFNCTYNKLYV